MDGGVGHTERCLVSLAAPCDEGISAGVDVDVHQVALTAQLVTRLVLLPHNLSACRIDGIERNLEDLVMEGVGKLKVVLVDKPHLVVGIAIPLVVINHAVARGERERGRQEERYVAEVFLKIHP